MVFSCHSSELMIYAESKPSRNVMITNSSFPPKHPKTNANKALVLPQGIEVAPVYNTPEDHDLFVRQFLMAKSERESHEDESQNAREAFRKGEPTIEDDSKGPLNASNREPLAQTDWHSRAVRAQRLDHRKIVWPTILICSHNSRDSRCGILGPLLEKEFQKFCKYRFDTKDIVTPMHIASISHVGGHAWAGNVLIYIPLQYRLQDGEPSALGGKVIWYGRVEPKHIEGNIQGDNTAGKHH